MLAYTLHLPIWLPLWWVTAVGANAADTTIPAARPAEDPKERIGLSATTTSAVSRHKEEPGTPGPTSMTRAAS